MSENSLRLGEYDDNKERVALRKLLRQFDEIKLDKYDYQASLGAEVSEFTDSYLYTLGDMFKTLGRGDFYFLPDPELIRIREYANQALDLFKRAEAEKVTQTERHDIIAASQKLYDECFPPVSSAIAYWAVKNLDVQGRKSEIEGAINQLGERRQEAERILRDLKETVQKATVAKEAVHFRNAAKSHVIASYVWLSVTAVLSLLTFILAWNSYQHYEEIVKLAFAEKAATMTVAQSIQLGVAKLFLFSLLVGGVVWCGRNYRAHRHNFVVNKHRQNALSTFDTFINSAQDQQTKSAVLLQATQAIFAPQPTGYISQESESGGLPQVFEIVRNIAESKDKS